MARFEKRTSPGLAVVSFLSEGTPPLLDVAPFAPADAGDALEDAERLVKRVSSEWALASFVSEEGTTLLEVAPLVTADA